MLKPLYTILTVLILILPGLAKAAFVNSPANFLPDSITELEGYVYNENSARITDWLISAFVSGNFENSLLQNHTSLSTELINEYRTKIEKDPLVKLVKDQIMNGKMVYMEGLTDRIFAVPVTDEQFQSIIGKNRMTTYKFTRFYKDMIKGNFFAKLGEYMVITDNINNMRKIISLAAGLSSNSLAKDPLYRGISDSFLSPHIFSFFINASANKKNSYSYYEKHRLLMPFSLPLMINAGYLKAAGLSVAKNQNGYSFTLKAMADPQLLLDNKVELNSAGNFVPNLFNEFPNAKPILYIETFNGKDAFPQFKKFIDKEEPGFLDDSTPIENFLRTFDKEVAFGIQEDKNSPVPYFTLIGNVSSDKEAGQKSADNLAGSILSSLEERNKAIGEINAQIKDIKNIRQKIPYSKIKVGQFTKITIGIDELISNRNIHSDVHFGTVTLTIGVTENGLLIASTYPDIEKEQNRTGLAANSAFAAFQESKESSRGIFYFSLRNYLEFADNLFLNQANNAGNYVSLKTYNKYYSALQSDIYSLKDLMLVKQVTSSDAAVKGTFITDNIKPKSLAEAIQELKSKDQDGDKVNDFDERYFYNTPINVADSDLDGVSDVEELKAGSDPNGKGGLFPDVNENEPYTEAVSILNQLKAVNKYRDGGFKPDRITTRAEFVAMTVKAFSMYTDQSTYFMGNFSEDYAKSYKYFTDISSNAWYRSSINKAYIQGFMPYGSPLVEGELNYDLLFHPEKKITRAEAVDLLNRAITVIPDDKLITTNSTECDPTPFTDIDPSDWSCNPVMSFYRDGLIKGKTDTKFKPSATLSRAEAATLIVNALKKENDTLISKPISDRSFNIFVFILIFDLLQM